MLSGNPGYQPGAPLLAAAVAPAGGLVRAATGLPLLATSATGECTQAVAAPMAQFGVDTRAACGVSLTRGLLRQFCQSGIGSTWQGRSNELAVTFSGLPTEQLFLGRWGDADASRDADWLPLAREVAGVPPCFCAPCHPPR